MEEKKIIHYCWFGPNKISKLAEKCLESWKKYLPDYEIMLHTEDNFDFNKNKFIKEAYENKKWAFVSDYARLEALYKYGGIYFDTDMEVTKDISEILEKECVFGVEDSKMVAAGFIYVKNSNNKFIKKILDIYDDMKIFDKQNIYKITIPAIITKEMQNYGYDKTNTNIQYLEQVDVTIYPQEYFYPQSYDNQKNNFTKNSCMIHHYDGTWSSKQEKIKIYFIRNNMKFMVKVVDIILAVNRKVKKIFKVK